MKPTLRFLRAVRLPAGETFLAVLTAMDISGELNVLCTRHIALIPATPSGYPLGVRFVRRAREVRKNHVLEIV